jgi:ferric enterobactin receptor
MKKFVLFSSLIFFFNVSHAQKVANMEEGTNQLIGKVVDANTKQGVEYATITLINTVSKKIVNGTITDKQGSFKLQKIKEGNYTIEIEFIGYIKFLNTAIAIKNENPQLVLQDVLLTKKSETLGAVVVTSKTQVIENKIDKIVYNVDKDITSQGGVATDALKKIPGVTVDVDGKVELLGNPSVRFLIDGKPSSLFGNSVADALQSIPNSQIQNIEVITSPSAKYDASGTGGIINIVLKKNKVQGFNGNMNMAIGTRIENGSLNFGYKKNNIGLNAFFSGNAQLKANTPTGSDRVSNNANTNYKTELIQASIDNDFNRNSYNAGIGMDWNLSKKDAITTTLAVHHFANRNMGSSNQTLLQYDNMGSNIYALNNLRNYDTKFYVNTFDNNLTYRRKFKKENQSLEIAYSGTFGNNNTFYKQSLQYNTKDLPYSGATSLNPGKENEVEFSIDYAQPITKDFLLETGAKTIVNSIISNADVNMLNALTGTYAKDVLQSYSSDYRRNIYGGYIAVSFSFLKNYELKAGARYELTKSTATYSNAGKVIIPNYGNLAPSFTIARSLPNKQILKLSYSYRLERPDYRDLNPFVNLSDPHNITTGNPNLQTEIGHNWQFNYNKAFESGANLNLLLYTERNFPDIKPYIIYYPVYKIGDSSYTDVSLTTRANIASEIKTGINIAVSAPVGKKLNLRSNTMLFTRNFNNQNVTASKISTVGFRLNLNATYQFTKTLVGEAFGNFNSGMQWQGRQPSVFSYTLAFRKQFAANKASIGFVAVNAFNKYIVQKSFSTATNVETNSYRNIPYRSFGISFNYKFGKIKFAKPKEGDNYLYSAPQGEN